MTESWDIALVGAGMAGLELARQLVRAHPDWSFLIVDPRLQGEPRPRTFGFWRAEDDPPLLEGISTHSWSKMSFAHRVPITLPLGSWRYHCLADAAVRTTRLRELREHESVMMLEDRVREIESFSSGPSLLHFASGREPERALRVFDSRWPPPDFTPSPYRIHQTQRFEGWRIRTKQDCFDPELPTLMDFRPHVDELIRFFYVLPFSPREALVECVTIGQAERPDRCDPSLYLLEILELNDWEVLHEEGGETWMTDQRFERVKGSVVRIGLAGGRLKPSSGYALTRIVRDDTVIAALMDSPDARVTSEDPPWTVRFLDAVMLTFLARRPERAPQVFEALFVGAEPGRVARFLEERATWRDVLAIVRALPFFWFVGACLFWLGMRARLVRAP